MTSDFLQGLRRFAQGLHRSCPSLLVDDLVQDALLHESSSAGACAERLYRIVRARNAMRSSYRREVWLAARVCGLIDHDTPANQVLPDAALDTLRLRRIVQARLAEHVKAVPELRPAVPVLLDEEQPRDVASRRHLDVSDLYRRAERLRARLREDHELQRLWLDYAEAA